MFIEWKVGHHCICSSLLTDLLSPRGTEPYTNYKSPLECPSHLTPPSDSPSVPHSAFFTWYHAADAMACVFKSTIVSSVSLAFALFSPLHCKFPLISLLLVFCLYCPLSPHSQFQYVLLSVYSFWNAHLITIASLCKTLQDHPKRLAKILILFFFFFFFFFCHGFSTWKFLGQGLKSTPQQWPEP